MNTSASASAAPQVSVLTATWNRAHLLPRCFESLCQQVPLPVEWIVVDDGSTDDTRRVMSVIAESSPFRVQYLSQVNAGKHCAVNRAAKAATGELALILDSDDMLTPNALGLIARAWKEIPETSRQSYAGIVGHSVDQRGTLIGCTFPADGERMTPLRLFHSDRVRGDKLFVHRVDILQKYPFPVFPGESFISEGIVWDRIRQSYRYRLLNEALQIVEYQADGLSASSLATRVKNPAGARAYYLQLASLDISWPRRLRSLVNYQRFATHGGVRGGQALADSPSPAVSALLFPLGALAATIDRARLHVRRNAPRRT